MTPHCKAALIFLPAILGCVPNLAPRACMPSSSGVRCICDTAGCADRMKVPQGWCSTDSGTVKPVIDFKEAALAARLSWLAYRPNDSIRTLGEVAIDSVDVGIPVFGAVKFFVWRDASGASPRQFLVIRGTANPGNALEDGKYAKAYDPGLQAWVHKGFLAAAKGVLAKSQASLDPGLRTFVTGHSLGGAAALLIYMHLYQDGRSLGPLYTFGQPKVLNEEATLRFRCLPAVRFLNEDDPVPYVPPTTKAATDTTKPLDPGFRGPYQHVGDEVILGTDSTWTVELFHDQYRHGLSYARNAVKLARDRDPAGAVMNHDMTLYMARLETLSSGTAGR